MLAITICSTRSYAYALIAQARKIVANLSKSDLVTVILVGDDSPEINGAVEFYKSILPEGSSVQLIVGKYEDGLPNYKNEAQLIIARMRSAAFDRARQLYADMCWSLDSDVLPPPNALRCMKQMLEFDDGFYSVSTCPYPSQGGGDFLGGRGTPDRPILPDFYDDERIVSVDLKQRMEAHIKRLSDLDGKPDQACTEEHEIISEEVKRSSPIGDVFFCNSRTGLTPFLDEAEKRLPEIFPRCSDLSSRVNSHLREIAKRYQPKGFRRRGWMSAAYPGLGLGAVLPSDWCGFGCALMGRRALSLAQFDGYDGGGTEDLYVIWKRWHAAGLRLNVIPNAPCDHVIRDPAMKGKFILCRAYHEQRDPECVGHLRIEPRPWYQQVEGESFAAQNNGQATSSTAAVATPAT